MSYNKQSHFGGNNFNNNNNNKINLNNDPNAPQTFQLPVEEQCLTPINIIQLKDISLDGGIVVFHATDTSTTDSPNSKAYANLVSLAGFATSDLKQSTKESNIDGKTTTSYYFNLRDLTGEILCYLPSTYDPNASSDEDKVKKDEYYSVIGRVSAKTTRNENNEQQQEHEHEQQPKKTEYTLRLSAIKKITDKNELIYHNFKVMSAIVSRNQSLNQILNTLVYQGGYDKTNQQKIISKMRENNLAVSDTLNMFEGCSLIQKVQVDGQPFYQLTPQQ